MYERGNTIVLRLQRKGWLRWRTVYSRPVFYSNSPLDGEGHSPLSRLEFATKRAAKEILDAIAQREAEGKILGVYEV